jgi:selenide,water dikinase
MDTALKYDVHACTDITGFGILGHGLEMAKGSNVRIDLHYDRLPFYPNAVQMYRKGETTGSNKANRKMAEGFWEVAGGRSLEQEELLFDPQTSGGLLLSVPGSQADDLLASLKAIGLDTAARVAEVVEWERPLVRIV